MSLFQRKKAASVSSAAAETVQETMQRRANGFIATIRQHRPHEFARLLSEVENGDLARARLILRELGDIVDEGYIDPILQQLQVQVVAGETKREY